MECPTVPTPAFETMNETDVRELVVRPLIQQLGYEPGTQNNVRSEVKLSYGKRVLGHRKPKTDHVMTGFADYLCEVISYGRWTTEVKAPHVELSDRDREQAFSYATHPEIAASHFLLTNGRVFRVYSTLEPTDPILEWTHETQSQMWVNIRNLLGPGQIRARAMREHQHRGKALALGLGASAQIVGGRLEYLDYELSHPLQEPVRGLAGLRATVEGERVDRDESGRIRARLRLAGPTAQWDALNQLAGVTSYEFLTSDEYISTLEESPTILQGLTQFHVPAGTSVKGLPGIPPGVDHLPFPMSASAFTQATGFLEGKTMRGVFMIEYRIRLPPEVLMAMGVSDLPPFTSLGDFIINLE
jgi:hypothetical protein